VRALVTGAAGFIGSHLVKALLAGDVAVVGVDDFTDYYDPELKRRNIAGIESDGSFDLVEADLNDTDVDPLLGGIDIVFHLAGQPGVRASWGDEFALYLDRNVRATQRLLEASKRADLRRFVFASSSSVYGDSERYPTSEQDRPQPVSPYGMTKLAAEHLCRIYWKAYSVPTVALRYFTIFGPRQRPDMAFNRFIRAALDNESIEIFGDGMQIRDFTYVSDAVAATISAGLRGQPGEIYNVAGGSQTSVREVVQILEELLGREVACDYGPPMAGDARRTAADSRAARRDLGFEPKVPLREGLGLQLADQRD
jgi:UDP-glucuronate 4-epimerase